MSRRRPREDRRRCLHSQAPNASRARTHPPSSPSSDVPRRRRARRLRATRPRRLLLWESNPPVHRTLPLLSPTTSVDPSGDHASVVTSSSSEVSIPGVPGSTLATTPPRSLLLGVDAAFTSGIAHTRVMPSSYAHAHIHPFGCSATRRTAFVRSDGMSGSGATAVTKRSLPSTSSACLAKTYTVPVFAPRRTWRGVASTHRKRTRGLTIWDSARASATGRHGGDISPSSSSLVVRRRVLSYRAAALASRERIYDVRYRESLARWAK
eukprot:28183-Pelagococcus_subviridis.AAC.2